MTGSAGGLSGALWARLGARLHHGASYVLDALGFHERMRTSAFVVTGEGRIDRQNPEGQNRGRGRQPLPPGRRRLSRARGEGPTRRGLGGDAQPRLTHRGHHARGTPTSRPAPGRLAGRGARHGPLQRPAFTETIRPARAGAHAHSSAGREARRQIRRASALIWTISPVALPSEARNPARGPPLRPDARQNNISGPGVSISTVTVSRKPTNSGPFIIRCRARGAARTSRRCSGRSGRARPGLVVLEMPRLALPEQLLVSARDHGEVPPRGVGVADRSLCTISNGFVSCAAALSDSNESTAASLMTA
jgi:hypothetical protein